MQNQDPRKDFEVPASPSGRRAVSPLHGTLIFVAVTSLVYGLACGCGESFLAVPVFAMSNDPQAARTVFRDQAAGLISNLESSSVDESLPADQRRVLGDLAASLKEKDFPAAMEEAGAKALASKDGQRLATLLLASVLSLALFILLAILLFSRVRWAWTFGLLLCAAAIALKVWLMLTARDVINAVNEGVAGFFPASEDLAASQPEGAMDGVLGGGLPILLAIVALFLTAWPLIAFLCLWFSRGIRLSLGLAADTDDVRATG